jgi:hypothetical protein
MTGVCAAAALAVVPAGQALFARPHAGLGLLAQQGLRLPDLERGAHADEAGPVGDAGMLDQRGRQQDSALAVEAQLVGFREDREGQVFVRVGIEIGGRHAVVQLLHELQVAGLDTRAAVRGPGDDALEARAREGLAERRGDGDPTLPVHLVLEGAKEHRHARLPRLAPPVLIPCLPLLAALGADALTMGLGGISWDFMGVNGRTSKTPRVKKTLTGVLDGSLM